MATFQFQPLKSYSLNTLAQLFNKAFSDYIVKVELSPQQMKQKIILDRIDLNYSVGALHEGKLVGFIFSAIGDWDGKRTAYNSGTGVVPEYRGNQLTKKMYDWLIPQCKNEGIHQGLLEVIDSNHPAIHNYKKVGFNISRSFDCLVLKGEKPLKHSFLEGLEQKELLNLDWDLIQSFWSFQPSWQNAIEGVKASSGQFAYLGVFLNEEMIAYGVKDPVKGRIAQFGVHPAYRKQSVGAYLFHSLRLLGNPKQSIINIDKNDEECINFLHSVGFEHYIGQYEMTCEF